MPEETHTPDKDEKTKISKYQKLKTKKKSCLKKRKNLTERKALVLKDFLICAGSVRFSIFRSESKHSTFQQGFFVFFSFSSSQIIYFSIIFYFSRFLPKFCRLSRVQDIDLPLHIAAADAVCFVSSQVAGGWSLAPRKNATTFGAIPDRACLARK